MTLIEQIGKDFITAYKAKEMEKKDFLGLLKSEVTKESKTPDDAYVVNKIKSMIKSAEATNSLSEDELEYMNTYLPKQMTEEELDNVIACFKVELNVTDMSGMGKIMGALKKDYNGQYDGKLASTIIKQNLV